MNRAAAGDEKMVDDKIADRKAVDKRMVDGKIVDQKIVDQKIVDGKIARDKIVQEIEIQSSAERIFDALTMPEELVKWWGVAGKFQVTGVESDLRVGGKWSFIMAGSDGREGVAVAGEYRQIERPHLLVYSWIREREDGAETVVRWELEEKSGVTRVRVTHSQLTSESLRGRNSGWPLILGLLQSYVEGRNEH